MKKEREERCENGVQACLVDNVLQCGRCVRSAYGEEEASQTVVETEQEEFPQREGSHLVCDVLESLI